VVLSATKNDSRRESRNVGSVMFSSKEKGLHVCVSVKELFPRWLQKMSWYWFVGYLTFCKKWIFVGIFGRKIDSMNFK